MNTKELLLSMPKMAGPEQTPATAAPDRIDVPGKDAGQTAKKTQGLTTATPAQTVPDRIDAPQSLSYSQMFEMWNKQKSDKDLEKELRKRKWESIAGAIGDGVSSLANLYFTTKGAKSVNYSPDANLSKGMQQRWKEMDEERKANKEKYLNGYMQARRMDEEAARNKAQDEREERNWKRQVERDRQQQEQWQQQFDRSGTQWQQQMEESKRQHDESAAAEKRRMAVQTQDKVNENYVSFSLGRNRGTVRVPKQAMNTANIAFIHSRLPKSLQAQGEPVYNTGVTGEKTFAGYAGNPTTEQQLEAIGRAMEAPEAGEAREALKAVAGGDVQKQEKKIGLK